MDVIWIRNFIFHNLYIKTRDEEEEEEEEEEDEEVVEVEMD